MLLLNYLLAMVTTGKGASFRQLLISSSRRLFSSIQHGFYPAFHEITAQIIKVRPLSETKSPVRVPFFV
jgi:hypothetical protein